MLTRLEIDGFKSFEHFSVDLAPFSVVLGSNASGKSNLFDAIELLARLATHNVSDAMKSMRGEPSELFRRTTAGTSSTMRFAAEVLVEPNVVDPWGNEKPITQTRIRYEIELALRTGRDSGNQVFVAHEAAKTIRSREDSWARSMKASPAFKKHHLRYSKRSNAFLETRQEAENLVFHLHHDGHQGRNRPAKSASASVLSTITDADFPHLFALREELRNWRLLQLDPAMLRRPSPENATDTLESDGSNLAAVLTRIKLETSSVHQPAGVLSAIAAELNSLIPGVKGLEAEFDKGSRQYKARLLMRDGIPFSSNVVSDGTLRVLALLTMLNDPRQRGVLCFEEPENGVHPGRLRDFIALLRDAACAPGDPESGKEGPLMQLLLNSHSPVVLNALLSPTDASQRQRVLLADAVSVADPASSGVRQRTRLRPVHESPQGVLIDFDEASERDVSAYEVQRILETASADA
jgi:predicted ATPase